MGEALMDGRLVGPVVAIFEVFFEFSPRKLGKMNPF